jgi:prolyl oligopeptidase
LVRQGHADPARLAIAGGSNAGLLVGAALTQRPELFRAVICLGPLLDMLRYHLFDSAHRWVDEYGSADDHADLLHLTAYSPYHHVADGVAYPAVMLISGDADTRCNPLHARKMAARLQAATNSNRPVLLDYKPRWGHTAAQPLGVRIESLTDRLAFLCHELGIRSVV